MSTINIFLLILHFVNANKTLFRYNYLCKSNKVKIRGCLYGVFRQPRLFIKSP
nr:MAG TPA: hypothetical protein [Caudoviricetes sp.]